MTTKDVEGDTVLMQASVFVPEIWGRSKLAKLRINAKYPEMLDYSQVDSQEDYDEHVVDYTVTGLWDNYDSSTGLVDRNTYSLADLESEGLSFEICKPVYSNYNNNIGDYKYLDAIPFTRSLEVEDMVLPSGKYRIRYSITDMLDRTYYTDFVNLTWDGQEAVYEFPPEEETIEDVEASDETENAAEASDETEDAARMITTRECFTRGIYFNDTGYYMNKLF